MTSVTTMTPLVQGHPPLPIHLGGAPELVIPEVGARTERLAQECEGEHTDRSVVLGAAHGFTQRTRINL